MPSTPLRVAFDVSMLASPMTGGSVYVTHLLQALACLDNPPTVTLFDGLGHRGDQLRAMVREAGLLPTMRYAPVRTWPSLHRMNGPWQKDFRTRRLSYTLDSRVLMPLGQIGDTMPLLARWRMPKHVMGPIDICHWSDVVCLNVPGVVHVATIHDTIVYRYPQWQPGADTALHRRKLRIMARSAARVLASSENTRHDLISLLGVPGDRIDVVPLAADSRFRPPDDPNRSRSIVSRYGLAADPYILFVGTLEPRKNLVRLATAFKRVIEQHPDLSLRLVLAGRYGWLTHDIERGLQALALGDRLVMPGSVPPDDLPSLLYGACAVAYVSLYEGFGLPPLEAMSCGTPVIVSQSSSLPEVVADAGLLVDPYSIPDITAALERIVTDPPFRAELAARSLRRAALFSWERTAQLTHAAYRRAMEMPHRVGRPEKAVSWT